eukprot:753036-Hanusia_phi.AAC.4
MRYQPLQQEEEKTQQMLLTASEVVVCMGHVATQAAADLVGGQSFPTRTRAEGLSSLSDSLADSLQVLEQRHAAQKAAQVGNLNALRPSQLARELRRAASCSCAADLLAGEGGPTSGGAGQSRRGRCDFAS